jgi:hypothetical protein
MSDRGRKFDVVPWLILGGVALVIVAGWWLFPVVFEMVQHRNCIAAGYVNC